MGKVVLYMTSTPTTLKLKHDIRRVQELLAAKNIPHEEVDLAEEPSRRADMMLHSNGLRSLPQLHVNDKYVGDAHTVQELEDFGELEDVVNAVLAEES
ncbi:g12036 [Coccomyxa viridis]|uniref:G12036 protein n=1 Tax=Coccomyxa viridis TaxID=1274662 RepID=A0ABP1GEZ8_9CHLO